MDYDGIETFFYYSGADSTLNLQEVYGLKFNFSDSVRRLKNTIFHIDENMMDKLLIIRGNWFGESGEYG